MKFSLTGQLRTIKMFLNDRPYQVTVLEETKKIFML